MAKIIRYFGASITLYIGAKQVGLDGVEKPLDMAGKVVWVRSRAASSLEPIDKATIALAPASEVSELAYDGDKTKATWLKLVLPASETSGSFAMAGANIFVFVGSAEGAKDAVPAIDPFTIERVGAGASEGVE